MGEGLGGRGNMGQCGGMSLPSSSSHLPGKAGQRGSLSAKRRDIIDKEKRL